MINFRFWKKNNLQEHREYLTKEQLVDKLIGEARLNNEINNDEMLNLRRKEVLERMW